MRARTWNLHLNLDEFNAAFAASVDDLERGKFVSGMSLGMNQGIPRKGASEAFLEGYALGKAMRDEAEAYREAKSEIGKKGGPQSWKPKVITAGEPVGKPVGEPDANPIPNPSILLTKESLLRSTPAPSHAVSPLEKPAKQKHKDKTGILPSASLEDLLGERGTPQNKSYWALVATFGEGKNPRPKTTAKQYLAAIEAGSTAERIQTVAQAYRNSVSDPKFMIQLTAWLEGEAYKTPDLPKSEGARASRSPAHRAAVDEAYLADVREREANRPPQVEMTDEEMEAIWGPYKEKSS